MGEHATVAQVDADAEAIGAHRAVQIGVHGDARATAEALVAALAERAAVSGRRTDALAGEIAAGRWRDEPFEPRAATGCDPRTPEHRARRPAARPSAPWWSTAAPSWAIRRCTCRCRTRRASSSRRRSSASGSALGNAIGAAVARPDRLTVAAVGDGGVLMALPDLETLGRLKPDMLVVVYDDAAYGAEVHHFRPMGIPVELAQFPPTDFAALAEAAGCRGATARTPDDLEQVARLARRTATARSCWTPKSTLTSVPNGWRRHSVATDTLTALASALADGSIRVVDLTQPLCERTPVLMLPAAVRQHAGALARGHQPLRRARTGAGRGRR